MDAIGSEILLRLDFENRGHHSAVAFSGRLLFLFQDANVPPMPVDFDHTGDIAPGVSMMWRSQPLTMAPPERALRPLVVGFLIRYADAVTGGRFCQVWWNRWRGLDERGNFQTVFNTVTSGEIETLKEKIERFEMACPPEGHI
ncbi:MAG: hypothetical protein Q7S43_05215 [bacterium]|nr:hypothetical protein [bacterium]